MRFQSALATFLFNACWQPVCIAVLSLVVVKTVDGLSGRLQYRFWSITALSMILVPLATTTSMLGSWSFRTIELRPDTISVWAIAFAAVALLGMVRLIWLTWRTHQLYRNIRPVPADDRISAVVKRCAQALHVKPVPTFTSSRITYPITAGGKRPIIVLPDEIAANASRDLLTCAVAHELGHVARRDFTGALRLELATMLLALHPAVRWVRYRVRLAREFACDELVAESIIASRVYAASLLAAAERALLARPSSSLALGVFDGDVLAHRLDRLLTDPPNRQGTWRVALALTWIMMACALSAAGGVGINRCYLTSTVIARGAIDLCAMWPFSVI